MSIELNTISSGYSTGLINNNFQRLEDYINQQLLNRDGTVAGEPNQMEIPLDMNSNPILNVLTDLTNSNSLLTLGDADSRYVNVNGDVMQGSLDMGGFPISVRIAVNDNEPVRKDRLDETVRNYQAGDANLQQQLTGNTPLEASAFSIVSWHDQEIENSVTIPPNKNAWSFGPVITIAEGQAVTISEGSFWTIANGEGSTLSASYDGGVL